MPFCVGVFFVILSIFIYGAKPEQIQEWLAAVGLVKPAQYALVAQMEPLHADEEAAAPSARDHGDNQPPPATPTTAASTPAAPVSDKKF